MKNVPNTKYISRVGNFYQIKKYVNGKEKHFGCFKNLNEVIIVKKKGLIQQLFV